MKLVINDTPPSNNLFIGRDNKWKYQENKRDWEFRVHLAVGRQRPPKPFAKAIVKITYYFRSEIRRDPDNFSGKFLLDGLRKSGVIKDDCFGCIKLELDGFVDPRNPRTEIEVLEVS